MNGISDPKIKSALKGYLKVLNKKLRHVHDRDLTLSDLEEIFKTSRGIRRASKKEIYKNMSSELSLTFLSISCCIFLTISIYKKEDEPNTLLPADWIDPKGLPNPNMVIADLLTQIVLFSISIIELVEKGLDNPARALTRTVIETTWQTLILLSSREDLKEYVKPDSFDETKEMWFKLFGKGRLQNKLAKIENSLNFDTESHKLLKAEREKAHQFFSESVHSGFVSSAVSSISWEFQSDNGTWSLLGGASRASLATIDCLNTNLFYFIRVFFAIITKLHRITPSKSDKYHWKEAFILQECITNISTAEESL